MRLISWNLNGRTACLAAQARALARRRPDLVALQEVTAKTAPLLAAALREAGLPHARDSFALAPDPSVLTGPRRYGQLVAGRWPLCPLPPTEFEIPWPERVLSVVIDSLAGPVELHTTHVPPGCNNGWTKVETLEGLYRRLAVPCDDRHRILCGDFNLPVREHADGRVVTAGQDERPDGTAVCWRRFRGGSGERWDAAERSVLLGLAAHDLADVFRALHGYGRRRWSFSYYLRRGTWREGRRFDHVFASRSLRPLTCEYRHGVRRRGLSDHALVEAVFDPVRVGESPAGPTSGGLIRAQGGTSEALGTGGWLCE